MPLATEWAQVAADRPGWIVRFPRGTEIVQEGTPADGVFLVSKGRVVLERGAAGSDQHTILRVVSAGAAFGAAEALAQTAYAATARTLEEVEVVQVPRAALDEFFQLAPTLALRLAELLAEEAVARRPEAEADAPAVSSAAAVAQREAADPPPEPPPAPGDAVDPVAAKAGTAENRVAEDGDLAASQIAALLDPSSIVPSLVSGPVAVEEEAAGAATASQDAPSGKAAIGAFYADALTCPICATAFEATRVRTSSLNAVKRESDLRTIYEGVNPVHYAIYVCPNCQYASGEDDWDTTDDDERARIENDTEERQRAAASFTFEGERDRNAVMLS